MRAELNIPLMNAPWHSIMAARTQAALPASCGPEFGEFALPCLAVMINLA